LIFGDRCVRRREFIKGIAGSAAWPLAARAQQTGKLAKVGYLGPSSLALEHVQVDAFKQRMHELGHVIVTTGTSGLSPTSSAANAG
jgi:hypothetical protein